jgi:hypothetical protein
MNTVDKWVLAIAATIGAVVILAIVAGSGTVPQGPTPEKAVGAVEKPSQEPEATPDPKPEQKDPELTEADDLVSLTLEEGDYGWHTASYEIHNHSSKPSDYDIRVDILDSNGNRVDHLWIFVWDVKPGQTVLGTDSVLGIFGEEVTEYTLSSVEVERSKSW